ncbi:MAG: hypothetical protein U0M80_09605 [Fusobacterium mortiferum]|jgi:hypothetical protein|uniref:Uncharacterized protein n=1 Tax=Fusobacterium mortiferum TaxID=850 RepID=A0A414PU46_FUSMR|nr:MULTISPECIES: hypothetical protein [Fusobacterium]MCF2628596.1 hypothetical protein [Fusobacterium mortiferum]MCF2700246.1 hypothetical protein [Fusobacterium mortiferum]MCI6382435.1 hypothetical protein [Fusobacterium mortiferum]MCI7188441.1 hypothetical protein [Fusobacterium mortiferum]MCI7666081.1 hypothetical protein [Fusobacterium mortiferum]
MEVISKDKPKGKAYSINKKMKKAKRLEEEKKFRRLTENKRKNAENRKERAIERAEAQRASEVILKGFSKGMLIISIEGKEEKRAPLFDKKKITKKNIEDEIDNFEIKLYGSNWKISILEGYEDIREQLIWEISELL